MKTARTGIPNPIQRNTRVMVQGLTTHSEFDMVTLLFSVVNSPADPVAIVQLFTFYDNGLSLEFLTFFTFDSVSIFNNSAISSLKIAAVSKSSIFTAPSICFSFCLISF